jgi:DNA-3-methyladenine glycosylase
MLGTVLECETEDGVASGIVETEAHLGEHDSPVTPPSVAPPAPNPLYGPPGIRTCIIHGCTGANAVTRAEGEPSAVLVRALEPLEGLPLMHRRRAGIRKDVDLTNGPGKLCAALGISGSLNRRPLQRKPLVIREGNGIANDQVEVTTRIGITKSADWPLRYIVRGNKHVSRGKVSA